MQREYIREPLFDPWLIGAWLGDGTAANAGSSS